MVCKGTGKKKEIGPKTEKWVVGKKREGVDERKGESGSANEMGENRKGISRLLIDYEEF